MLVITQILCLVLGALSALTAALFLFAGNVATYQAFSFSAVVFMAVWLFLRTAQRHYSHRSNELDAWEEKGTDL